MEMISTTSALRWPSNSQDLNCNGCSLRAGIFIIVHIFNFLIINGNSFFYYFLEMNGCSGEGNLLTCNKYWPELGVAGYDNTGD